MDESTGARATGARALIVVDVQNGTVANARSVPIDRLIDNVNRLLRTFRASGDPVVFVRTTGANPGRTTYGSEGRAWPEPDTRLDSRLQLEDGDLILPKVGWSAFAAPGVHDHLRDRDVREVVITGLATTFGVESTARSAADLGYDVVVVRDAVSDPDPAGHERTLTRVVPALGRVASTDEVVERGQSGSPR